MSQNIAILYDTYIGSLGNPSSGEIGKANLAFIIYMNDWFLAYCCLALGGALISWYRVYLPVRSRLKLEGFHAHPYVSNTIISSIVWLLAAMLLIPFLARALIMDSKLEVFIQEVYKGAK